MRNVVTVLAVAIAAISTTGMVRIGFEVAGALNDDFYRIPGTAMAPSIQAGDRIRCSPDVPAAIPRGSVVTIIGDDDGFGSGWGPTRVAFRVVGLPGERISSAPNRVDVYINGNSLSEPYADKSAEFVGEIEPTTLAADTYYVLGDNRDGATDSRYNGPVPRRFVTGLCTRIVSPADRAGRIPGT